MRRPPGGGSSVRGGDPTASLKVPEACPCGAESGVRGTSRERPFHICPGHLWPAQPILWHPLGGQGCRHPWVNWLRRPGPPSCPEAGRWRTQHSPNADPRLHDGPSVSLCGALEPAGSWGLGRPGLARVVLWPESGVGSALSQWVPREDVTSEGPAVPVPVNPSHGQSPLAGPGEVRYRAPSQRPCALGPREAGGRRPPSADRHGPTVASPLLFPFLSGFLPPSAL